MQQAVSAAVRSRARASWLRSCEDRVHACQCIHVLCVLQRLKNACAEHSFTNHHLGLPAVAVFTAGMAGIIAVMQQQLRIGRSREVSALLAAVCWDLLRQYV